MALARTLLGTVLVALPALVQAQSREADKTDPVKRIMAREFEVGQPEKPFCVRFLADFKKLNGIKFVEPIARANQYESPALARFREQCAPLPLNEKFECEGRDIESVKWSEDPVRQREQALTYCKSFLGTSNFKIFQFDANNNSKDGEELVVYFERARGPVSDPASTRTINGGYYAFAAKSCARLGEAPSHDPFDYFFARPVENYSGIISYRNAHYVFDLYALIGNGDFPANPHYWLSLSTFGDDRRDWCSYSTLSLRRVIEKNRRQSGKKE